MIAFCISILSFVWRTGSVSDPSDGNRPPLTDAQAIGVRVLATVIFALGVLKFSLIMKTFGAYSEAESGRKGRWRARFHSHSDRRGDFEDDRNTGRGRGVRQDAKRGNGVMGLGLSGLGGREAVDDVDVIVETAGSDAKSKAFAKDDMFFVGGGRRISPRL